jgi:hypothetical protein
MVMIIIVTDTIIGETAITAVATIAAAPSTSPLLLAPFRRRQCN